MTYYEHISNDHQMTHEHMTPHFEFHISEDNYDDLIDEYERERSKNGIVRSIIERPGEYSCLVIKVDFNQVSRERVYKRRHMTELVRYISEYLTISYENFIDSGKIASYLHEKDHPHPCKFSEPYDDGIRIYFQSIVLSDVARRVIIDHVRWNLKKENEELTRNMKKYVIGDLSQIFDVEVIRTGLYGSKGWNGETYECTRKMTYDVGDDEVRIEEFYENEYENPSSLFSLANKELCKVNEYKIGILSD